MSRVTELTAPIIACVRHRLQSDGEGVTTLVAFHGCPLRCRYCLNPFSFDPDARREYFTPQELYDRLKIDALYFLATGGGVTFGGGEPLLYPQFLQVFRHLCGEAWRLCVETSLAVPWEHVQQAAACVDVFYVDCKDTDASVYRRYTGADNRLMLTNLERLLTIVPSDRIVVRLPLIPQYNSDKHVQNSRLLLEKMGITRFDEFVYNVKK